MPLKVTYAMSISAVETFGSALLAASDKTLTIDGVGKKGTLQDDGAIPATQRAAGTKALADGAATLDLRALPDDATGRTLDGNGKKVQLAILSNPAANANPITVAAGESDGYDLFGADGEVTLKPGQAIMLFGNEALADVSNSAKILALSGTGTQALEYHLILG